MYIFILILILIMLILWILDYLILKNKIKLLNEFSNIDIIFYILSLDINSSLLNLIIVYSCILFENNS